MTKEEILAMEAGVELDAMIAEWKDGCYHDWKGQSVIHGGLFLECAKCGAFRGSGRQLPNQHYSTDIQAAWPVLKKLREDYWCIEIKIADGCWVIMELLGTPPIKVEVNAGTPLEKLPETICKAALLAKLETE